MLKSSFSEMGLKIRKNLPLSLTLLSSCFVKTSGRFFSNFVAFSQCLDFTVPKSHLRKITGLFYYVTLFSFDQISYFTRGKIPCFKNDLLLFRIQVLESVQD